MSSKVSVVTLALLESLLSFNLEDVMVSLVFQHLVGSHHLLRPPTTTINPPFQPAATSETAAAADRGGGAWRTQPPPPVDVSDPQGRAAHKFLSLAPVSCDPPATPVTPRRSRVSTGGGGAPASLTSLGSRGSLVPPTAAAASYQQAPR